jgi:hypothetical protein
MPAEELLSRPLDLLYEGVKVVHIYQVPLPQRNVRKLALVDQGSDLPDGRLQVFSGFRDAEKAGGHLL